MGWETLGWMGYGIIIGKGYCGVTYGDGRGVCSVESCCVICGVRSVPCCGCFLLGFPVCVPLFGRSDSAIPSIQTEHQKCSILTVNHDVCDRRFGFMQIT